MSNRVEPEIPSITLDHDQVKSVTTSQQKTSTHESNSNTVKQSSVVNNLFTFIIYLALGATSWFFYQESLKLQQLVHHSEQRIQQLENQLSATGEEMGESTIALKVKLEAISEKTEKLWGEMDKLWASAWRKNQTEIKALRSNNKKQETLNKNHTQQISQATLAINNVNDKLTSTEFSVTALADKISATNNIQTKINELTSQLSTLEGKSSGRDTQQMEVATHVSQLEIAINLLLERIERIEKQPKQAAKKPVKTTL